jgi:hypothetical protein
MRDTMTTYLKHVLSIAAGTAVLLLIPLFFTLTGSGVDGQGVHWTGPDFVIAGGLLFAVGLLIDRAYQKFGSYRIPAIIAIVFLFLWLWAELAVGVFTNWGS